MKTWIALLRGVNVGGKNKLPMKSLATELETLGLHEVRTYIQSGNVVFDAPSAKKASLASQIGGLIQAKFGFLPHVQVISDRELKAAMTANPFPEAVADMEGRLLHFFFLDRSPTNFDRERLESIRRKSERWQIKDSILYLHAPEGIGDSKLAAQIERILGVPATARNWRTVNALMDLAAERD